VSSQLPSAEQAARRTPEARAAEVLQPAGEQPAAQHPAGGSPSAQGPSGRAAAACRPVVQRGAPAEALKDWTTGAFERNSALGYPQPLPLNFSPYIIFPPIFSPIFSTPAAVPPKYSPYTPLPL
jgi:hypothetical protein